MGECNITYNANTTNVTTANTAATNATMLISSKILISNGILIIRCSNTYNATTANINATANATTNTTTNATVTTAAYKMVIMLLMLIRDFNISLILLILI